MNRLYKILGVLFLFSITHPTSVLADPAVECNKNLREGLEQNGIYIFHRPVSGHRIRLTSYGVITFGTNKFTVWRVKNPLQRDIDATLKSASGAFTLHFRAPARRQVFIASSEANSPATHLLRRGGKQIDVKAASNRPFGNDCPDDQATPQPTAQVSPTPTASPAPQAPENPMPPSKSTPAVRTITPTPEKTQPVETATATPIASPKPAPVEDQTPEVLETPAWTPTTASPTSTPTNTSTALPDRAAQPTPQTHAQNKPICSINSVANEVLAEQILTFSFTANTSTGAGPVSVIPLHLPENFSLEVLRGSATDLPYELQFRGTAPSETFYAQFRVETEQGLFTDCGLSWNVTKRERTVPRLCRIVRTSVPPYLYAQKAAKRPFRLIARSLATLINRRREGRVERRAKQLLTHTRRLRRRYRTHAKKLPDDTFRISGRGNCGCTRVSYLDELNALEKRLKRFRRLARRTAKLQGVKTGNGVCRDTARACLRRLHARKRLPKNLRRKIRRMIKIRRMRFLEMPDSVVRCQNIAAARQH